MTILALPEQDVHPVAGCARAQVVLLGEPGIGKTHWSGKFPNSLFAKTEPGTDFIRRREVDITSWEDFQNTVELLCTSEHDREWLIIDTLDRLYDHACAHLCAIKDWETIADGPLGSGYAKVGDMLRREAMKLYFKSPVSVIWISHVKVQDMPNGRKVIKPSVAPSAMKVLNEFVTVVAYAGVRAGVKGQILRTIYFGTTQNLGSIEVKDRTGRLPDYIDMQKDDASDVEQFLQTIRGEVPSAQETPPETKDVLAKLRAVKAKNKPPVGAK